MTVTPIGDDSTEKISEKDLHVALKTFDSLLNSLMQGYHADSIFINKSSCAITYIASLLMKHIQPDALMVVTEHFTSHLKATMEIELERLQEKK